MNNLIREVTKSDIFEIEKIEKACFSDSWSIDSINSELSNSISHIFVYTIDDIAVGYIIFWEVYDECQISRVAVNPNYQNQRICSKLLDKTIEYCLNKLLSFATLEVRESNSIAIKAYENHGFITLGKRKNFYENPNEDALIMTRKFK